MPTSILLVGAGAVGAFYASRLDTVPDVEVSVVCRSNYEVVNASGFDVESSMYGSYRYLPKLVFGSTQEATGSGITWDYIIVCTKALPDVSDDSALLEGLVVNETAIVLMQNGLGIEELYRKRFPRTTILSAVTLISVAQTSPGIIRHYRWTRVSTGPYLPSNQPSKTYATKRNAGFVAMLKAGGIEDVGAYDHATMQLARWHKTAINAAMNPSSVLSGGASNYAMSTDSELLRHLEAVINEVLTTAAKVVALPPPKEFPNAETFLNSARSQASDGKPSMWHDWETGKEM
ncbi:MAG: hypothetical protein M1828_005568 [Chrysothrix sp. TS-e1954]|nr:MAG: hypothetical protein M1828_005568 [Chrysothrix sp. TS-e1954]